MKKVFLFVAFLMLAIMSAMCSAHTNLRTLPYGSEAELNGAIVTVSTTDYWGYPVVYAHLSDRTFGIYIWSEAGQYFYEGDCISAKGFVSQFLDTGEPVFVIPSTETITVESNLPLTRPLGMSQKATYQDLVLGNHVRLWGNVTATSNPYDYSSWYFDDGSDIPNDLNAFGDATKGIKIWGNCSYQNGNQVAISGVVGLYNYYDAIVTCFYPSGNQSNEVRGSTKYVVSGTIATDLAAAGKKVSVITDGGSTSCTLDSNGIGTYSLSLASGNYSICARLIGYKTQTKKLSLTTATALNFNLTKLDKEKVIDLEAPYNMLPPDGSTVVDVRVTVRDLEGRPFANEQVSASLDNGTILTPMPVATNENGVAQIRVRSSNQHESGLLTVTCGAVNNNMIFYYAAGDDPIVWPDEIWQGKVLAGNVPVKFYTMDLSLPETATADDQMNMLYEYSFEVDGQEVDGGIPIPVEDPDYGLIPMAYSVLRTNNLSNGPHTIRVKITNTIGRSFYSLSQTFTADNDVSNVRLVSSSQEYPDEVDLLGGGTVNITATFKEPTSVKVTAYEFNPTLSPSLCNGREIANGTYSTLNCSWDGKIFPENGTNQPDQVYVEISSTSPSQTPGNGVGRWYGVRTIPDENVEVLVFAGKYTHPDDLTEEALVLWPVRTYTLYRRAKDRGMAAIRLNPEQSTWPRLKKIIGNGHCRIIYGFCHGNCQTATGTGTPSSSGTTCLWLKGGHVTSRATPAWKTQGSFDELNLTYSNRIKLCHFDSCLSGRRGGNISNPYSTAPDVPNQGASGRNDMAEVLGMYYDEYTPAVYVGWHGYGRGGMDWTNFISSVNYPHGFHELWTRTSGWEVSRIIGRYPYGGVGASLVLTQPNGPNAPNTWYDIQQNLRCFGAGLLGANQGYYEVFFN